MSVPTSQFVPPSRPHLVAISWCISGFHNPSHPPIMHKPPQTALLGLSTPGLCGIVLLFFFLVSPTVKKSILPAPS